MPGEWWWEVGAALCQVSGGGLRRVEVYQSGTQTSQSVIAPRPPWTWVGVRWGGRGQYGGGPGGKGSSLRPGALDGSKTREFLRRFLSSQGSRTLCTGPLRSPVQTYRPP